ncbi:MAG TPA: thioesterase family protein [Methylomirabilota bacterium]|nr:thioesterase family protein [Methylomirabilota bacterium]
MASFTIERWVNWSQCDAAGIVYYPNVFAWFDEAAEEFFRALGWSWRDFFPEEGIAGMPIVEAHCRFLAPMSHGERVKVTVSATEVGRKSFKLLYEITMGDTLRASGHEVRVFAERDPGKGTIRAAVIPEAVKRKLTGH